MGWSSFEIPELKAIYSNRKNTCLKEELFLLGVKP